MPIDPETLAQVRFENALALFDEFVHATVKQPHAAPLRGLDGLFAERLRIQPSYWSQIKARSRQIGERLARQFEQRCGKPEGWIDEVHAPSQGASHGEGSTPVDDDERFVVSLVLSWYRRDPARARTRLLELLGEALQPTTEVSKAAAADRPVADDARLWAQARATAAPLKRRR